MYLIRFKGYHQNSQCFQLASHSDEIDKNTNFFKKMHEPLTFLATVLTSAFLRFLALPQ